jgi:hypothetical protein
MARNDGRGPVQVDRRVSSDAMGSVGSKGFDADAKKPSQMVTDLTAYLNAIIEETDLRIRKQKNKKKNVDELNSYKQNLQACLDILSRIKTSQNEGVEETFENGDQYEEVVELILALLAEQKANKQYKLIVENIEKKFYSYSDYQYEDLVKKHNEGSHSLAQNERVVEKRNEINGFVADQEERFKETLVRVNSVKAFAVSLSKRFPKAVKPIPVVKMASLDALEDAKKSLQSIGPSMQAIPVEKIPFPASAENFKAKIIKLIKDYVEHPSLWKRLFEKKRTAKLKIYLERAENSNSVTELADILFGGIIPDYLARSTRLQSKKVNALMSEIRTFVSGEVGSVSMSDMIILSRSKAEKLDLENAKETLEQQEKKVVSEFVKACDEKTEKISTRLKGFNTKVIEEVDKNELALRRFQKEQFELELDLRVKVINMRLLFHPESGKNELSLTEKLRAMEKIYKSKSADQKSKKLFMLLIRYIKVYEEYKAFGHTMPTSISQARDGIVDAVYQNILSIEHDSPEKQAFLNAADSLIHKMKNKDESLTYRFRSELPDWIESLEITLSDEAKADSKIQDRLSEIDRLSVSHKAEYEALLRSSEASLIESMSKLMSDLYFSSFDQQDEPQAYKPGAFGPQVLSATLESWGVDYKKIAGALVKFTNRFDQDASESNVRDTFDKLAKLMSFNTKDKIDLHINDNKKDAADTAERNLTLVLNTLLAHFPKASINEIELNLAQLDKLPNMISETRKTLEFYKKTVNASREPGHKEQSTLVQKYSDYFTWLSQGEQALQQALAQRETERSNIQSRMSTIQSAFRLISTADITERALTHKTKALQALKKDIDELKELYSKYCKTYGATDEFKVDLSKVNEQYDNLSKVIEAQMAELEKQKAAQKHNKVLDEYSEFMNKLPRNYQMVLFDINGYLDAKDCSGNRELNKGLAEPSFKQKRCKEASAFRVVVTCAKYLLEGKDEALKRFLEIPENKASYDAILECSLPVKDAFFNECTRPVSDAEKKVFQLICAYINKQNQSRNKNKEKTSAMMKLLLKFLALNDSVYTLEQGVAIKTRLMPASTSGVINDDMLEKHVTFFGLPPHAAHPPESSLGQVEDRSEQENQARADWKVALEAKLNSDQINGLCDKNMKARFPALINIIKKAVEFDDSKGGFEVPFEDDLSKNDRKICDMLKEKKLGEEVPLQSPKFLYIYNLLTAYLHLSDTERDGVKMKFRSNASVHEQKFNAAKAILFTMLDSKKDVFDNDFRQRLNDAINTKAKAAKSLDQEDEESDGRAPSAH